MRWLLLLSVHCGLAATRPVSEALQASADGGSASTAVEDADASPITIVVDSHAHWSDAASGSGQVDELVRQDDFTANIGPAYDITTSSNEQGTNGQAPDIPTAIAPPSSIQLLQPAEGTVMQADMELFVSAMSTATAVTGITAAASLEMIRAGEMRHMYGRDWIRAFLDETSDGGASVVETAEGGMDGPAEPGTPGIAAEVRAQGLGYGTSTHAQSIPEAIHRAPPINPNDPSIMPAMDLNNALDFNPAALRAQMGIEEVVEGSVEDVGGDAAANFAQTWSDCCKVGPQILLPNLSLAAAFADPEQTGARCRMPGNAENGDPEALAICRDCLQENACCAR